MKKTTSARAAAAGAARANEKGPVAANDKALPKTHQHRKFSPKSTATEVQERRILEALKAGPKTTCELRAIGVYQVSARIFELRKRGHNIATTLFDGWAADGYSHARMARYELLEVAE